MFTHTFALALNWDQILTTGGFAVATLIASGIFFNRKVWPFIEEYVKHQRQVAEGYQQALTNHIAQSHQFITAQLDRAQRERAEELKLFIAEQQRVQQQVNEGRAQFLESLRRHDETNQRTARILEELVRELKLDAKIKTSIQSP